MLYDGIELSSSGFFKNLKLEPVTVFPESPTFGEMVCKIDGANSGLYFYDGVDWKNLLAIQGGIQTKTYSQTYTTANNTLFINAADFIGDDICLRLTLDITNGSSADAVIVAISNLNGDIIQTIHVDQNVTEKINLTAFTNVKIYVSGSSLSLTITLN